MSSVKFISHKQDVLSAMGTAKKRALTAIGEAAVEVTTDYMQSRYGTPIRQSGDLMRDVNFRVVEREDKVSIGNSLEYAPWVHNGTASMSARPYLRDAATENTDIWQEITEEHLKKEMR